MSETQSQDDPHAEQTTRDGKPAVKPLGDSWTTSEPATGEARPKPKVKPLGDSWTTSEPATGEAKPSKPKVKPLGDSWTTSEPAAGESA